MLRTMTVVQAMADPVRLQMSHILTRTASSGSMLARALGIHPNRAHYHLRRLSDAGLVQEVSEGPRGRTTKRLYAATGRPHLDTVLLDVVTLNFGSNEIWGGNVISTFMLSLPAQGLTVRTRSFDLVTCGRLALSKAVSKEAKGRAEEQLSKARSLGSWPREAKTGKIRSRTGRQMITPPGWIGRTAIAVGRPGAGNGKSKGEDS